MRTWNAQLLLFILTVQVLRGCHMTTEKNREKLNEEDMEHETRIPYPDFPGPPDTIIEK